MILEHKCPTFGECWCEYSPIICKGELYEDNELICKCNHGYNGICGYQVIEMIDITDTKNRPPITYPIRESIKNAFNIVPVGKSSALIAIWDIEAEKARLHYAWKINEIWKVGAQVGWSLNENLSGYAGVEAAW